MHGERQEQLLWGDFDHSTIIPGLTRHSTAAQDEVCLAALRLGAPEWVHANMLQPAAHGPAGFPAQPQASMQQHSIEALPLVSMLPAYDDHDIVLSSDTMLNNDADFDDLWDGGEVWQGQVRGREAIIKLVDNTLDDIGLLQIAAEARANLASSKLNLL